MKRYRIRRLLRRPEGAGARVKTYAEQALEEAEAEARKAPPEVERSFNRGCMGCTTAFLIMLGVLALALLFGRCVRVG